MKTKIPNQGIFVVYKPKGPTSNEVLRKIRKITGIKKVGHAGTLDPLAKGILVVGVGRDATKKLFQEVKKEKEYIAQIKLGATSATDDAEGEILRHKVLHRPTLAEVEKQLKKFKGKIQQVPPVFSAVKIKGREAYKLARQGREVTLKAREVEIKEIEILKFRWPFLWLRVITGPGVYIRAIARDIGKELGVNGYLANLERTRVGDFDKRGETVKLDL